MILLMQGLAWPREHYVCVFLIKCHPSKVGVSFAKFFVFITTLKGEGRGEAANATRPRTTWPGRDDR